MMSDKLIFYDLANRKNEGWSPNPWKTRAALNFKGIPYTTEWVEYPDLKPKFEAFGIPPNQPPCFADYSCPTVRFPDGSYMMDSMPIADRLEAMKPEPSLHLDSGLHKVANDATTQLIVTCLPDVLMPIIDEWLQEPSKSWFRADREAKFGVTLEQVRDGMGGEVGWAKTVEHLDVLAELLTKHKKDEGPFVLGSTPSYSDLIIVALFEGLRRLDGDLKKMLGYHESFPKVYEACKPWFERAD